MASFAPLVLFVYNRPLYTQKVLDALAANPEAKHSFLYIYCDGAKQNATDDVLHKIEETRKLARSENRFKSVKIIEQPANKGLANSIIAGVSEICNKYGSIIVLEDDTVTSPFFLRYMNEALQIYKDVDKVGSICGYWYPTQKQVPELFFLKNPSCWGWATWLRVWNTFETDGIKLLSKLNEKKLTKKFDLEGSMQYTQMLKDQISGKVDSWAIRWEAGNFINNKMSLYPGFSLVQNIGFDGSGVHSGSTNYFDVPLSDKPITVSLLPIVESGDARVALIQFYKSMKKGIFVRLLHRFLRLLNIKYVISV
jgi:glycosyltransferase involved in cell wall biosynthesis